MNSDARTRVSYFGGFDGMRGIAVLAVAAYHAEWLYWGYESALIRHAAFMVDFFFVLSGFVICHTYGHRVSTARQVQLFMSMRFWRLYPVHLTFLGILLMIEIARFAGDFWFGVTPNVTPFTEDRIGILVGNLLLIHSLGFFDKLAYNAPSWTISTEFFAYLVFGLVFLVLASRRSRVLASALIAAICVAGLVLFNDNSLLGNTPRFGFVRRQAGFFCGVMVWHAYSRLRDRHGLAKIRTWLSGLSLVLLALWVLVVKFGYGNPWEFAILPVTCGLILSVALNQKGPLARLFGTRPLAWLGKISFSVYMAHIAVLWVFSQVLRFVFKVPLIANDHGSLTYQTDPFMGSVLLVAYIVAVLSVSYLSFIYIEEAFRKKSKARFKQKTKNG